MPGFLSAEDETNLRATVAHHVETFRHRPAADTVRMAATEAAIRAEAAAAACLPALRERRDLLAEQLADARLEHARAIADADQKAAAVRSAALELRDFIAAERVRDEAGAEVRRLAVRIEMLQEAARHAADEVAPAEQKAVRLAAGRRLGDAAREQEATAAAVAVLTDEFLNKLVPALIAAADAKELCRAVGALTRFGLAPFERRPREEDLPEFAPLTAQAEPV